MTALDGPTRKKTRMPRVKVKVKTAKKVKKKAQTRGCCRRKHLRVADFNAVIIFSAFVSEMSTVHFVSIISRFSLGKMTPEVIAIQSPLGNYVKPPVR